MNNRERFLKTMHFEKVDHPPFYVDSPWADTMQRWYGEGYPRGVELADFLRIEDSLKIQWVPIDYWLIPPFERKVEYEDEEVIIQTNQYGVQNKTYKKLSSQPYEEVEFAVKTGTDLLKLVNRLRTDLPGRIPSNWEELKKQWRANDGRTIICAAAGNYWSTLVNLMGLETLSLMLYDERETIRQFLDAYQQSIMWALEQAFHDVRIDYIHSGEDFAYKTSSHLSSTMYREFIQPRHKVAADFARERGVDIYSMDSDGNLATLLPDMIAGGVNLIFPVECAADMDVLQLRKKFGRQLRMWGGIDKREIAKGKEAIRRELLKKVPPLIKEGGYIPCIDHSVDPDISLDNFVYYVEQLKTICGVK